MTALRNRQPDRVAVWMIVSRSRPSGPFRPPAVICTLPLYSQALEEIVKDF